jgi:MYXO-CTERM domain-containing protein
MRSAVAVALLPAALLAAPIHYQRVHPQGSGAIDRYGSGGAAPANAWLNYYGGHVISNVKVVPVMWGSNVPSQVATGIGAFYTAVTDSAHFDWLAEYDTNILDWAGDQGTNQHIGRGTATATIAIAPSITATSITNDQIIAELRGQIASGRLPKPDASTLYMVHFPAGMKISMPDGNGGTASSCTQFCAYHNTASATSTIPEFYYGVIPNVTSDGCEFGCGPIGGGFNNTTSVASHELVEAVTDAEVGLAVNNAPPLAWYDPQGQNGEIGDICNGSQGTVTSHGQSWTVQQEWSNSHDACITLASSTDFAVVITPGNRAIAAGQSATYTVTAKTIAGSPGTISLKADGMAAGLSGSFASSAVSPGQSTTLTVSASSSATNGDNYFTIHGTAGGTQRTAKAEANISGGQTGGGGGGSCPPGTTDIGGVCVPTGCGSAGGGPAWLGALAVGAFLLWRRRSHA